MRAVETGSADKPAFLLGLARLVRPANVVTAYADILAGFATAPGAPAAALPYLLVATTGLYGGGVALNDVFDAKLDTLERPERPIPSGSVSLTVAAVFGAALLAGGILLAWRWSALSGLFAFATAAAALLYDAAGKHHAVLGPINMGLCRALNLLVGATAAGHIAGIQWLVAAVPLCYIAGITALSRGEVKGGTRAAARISTAWLITSLVLVLTAAAVEGPRAAWCIPFIAALLVRIVRPFRSAFVSLSPAAIRNAVRTGVLSLILLDASLAALFAGPWYAVGILLLYFPAMLLAKLFAVT
jgi:4-hydroxybenzoate polyprenyltransferase